MNRFFCVFACLLIASVAAQKSLPAGLFDHFKAEGISAMSPSPCNGLLVLTSQVWDSAAHSTKSLTDCGSISTSNIINCATSVMAVMTCYGASNCSCMTFKLDSSVCSGPSPVNSSMFEYVGTRTWFGNIAADVFAAQIPGKSSVTNSLFIANGAVVGSEVTQDGKVVASIIYTKWSSAPVNPNEFEIPSWCPAPRQATRARHANNMFHF